MNIKQLIYKLIDNEYNNNDISIVINSFLINELNYEFNDLKKGTLILYNALKLNYTKYKHIINQIIISNDIYYIINLNTNFYKYFILNNNLINISIFGRLINNDNLKILCSSLKNLNNLKMLDLRNNDISDLTPLNDIIKNNYITSLNLSYNKIINIDILGEYLKNNTSLKQLYLSYNKISNFKNFIENIQNNKVLKVLDIRNNMCINKTNFSVILSSKIDDICINSINYLNDINKYLQNNSSLQELYIENPYYIRSNREGNILFNVPSQSYSEYIINQEEYLNKYKYDLSNIFKTLEYNNSLKN